MSAQQPPQFPPSSWWEREFFPRLETMVQAAVNDLGQLVAQGKSPIATPGGGTQRGGIGGQPPASHTVNLSAVDLAPLAALPNLAANQNFAQFTAPFAGEAEILISLATPSTLSLIAAPKGSSSFSSLGPVDNGATVPAAQPQTFRFAISAGARYALQLGAVQTGQTLVSVKGVPQ